ncbi:MAG: hypothetical protein KME21_31650 [Desmonostoc vinosum HA7617-LM4]|jgi:hypothetical protein|nr:hypothetical protein [Desmonostoc vinosum HA7617-LM4]
MKFLLLALTVLIGALFVTPRAYANEENVSNTTNDQNQAAVLLTEPVTINDRWSNINQTNNFKQTADSISIKQQRECQNINPLDFISDADTILKQCQKQTNNQTSPTEPIEYLKVPRLDSGINVTVTKF